MAMRISQTFQTNREFHITRSDNVLNLEIGEFGSKAEFLNDTCVFSACKFRVILRFGTSDDHLARSKNKGRRLGFTDTHDNSSETLITYYMMVVVVVSLYNFV